MISELMADEISHKKESLSSVTNLNPIHREIYDSAYQIIRDKNLNFELLFL